jgi:cytochrome oxidase assembly protein ShyY1
MVTAPAYGPGPRAVSGNGTRGGYRLRVKEERRELAGLLAIAVVFAIACVFLGRWQYHRFQAKYAADHLVGNNYRAHPVDIDTLLPTPSATLPGKDRWRAVKVTGQYDAAAQVVVRNRPFGGAYGYEVLAPFRPASGGSDLLVDRGWIESGTTGAAPNSIPAVPTGTVTVTAHLLPSEARKTTDLPQGQFDSIDLDQIQAQTGTPLLRAYGVLSDQAPAAASVPALLPEPDDGGYWGVNLSYAFQWGLFAVGALAFPFIFLRRRRRLAEEDAAAAAAALDPTAVPVTVPKRKVRIWDEEDG